MKKPRPNPHPNAVEVVYDSDNDVCCVNPGKIHIGTANTHVKWDNKTGDDIFIFIPEKNLKADWDSRKILKGGPALEIELNPTNVGGSYPYAVYCQKTNSFALGGSEPEMIVP